MIRLWYVEEPEKYTHEKGNALGIFKYKSSANIYLEQLNKIPGNDKRTFVINHYNVPISKFPDSSWVWNTSEKEENKMLRGEQIDMNEFEVKDHEEK